MPYNQPYGYPGYAMNIPSGTADTINGVPQVSSIDEVRAASVPYGVTIFMTDHDVFYAKNSQGLIKAFKFEEVPIPSNDPQNFVTREEFDNLRRQYEQLTQQYATATATPIAAQPIANTATTQYDSTAGTAGIVQPNSQNGMDTTASEPISGYSGTAS